MFYALNSNVEKIEASPKGRAVCPFCQCPVIACTGEIKSWYWRHEKKQSSCVANNYEYEGPWHANWKRMFGAQFSEIVCAQGEKRRIADIMLNNGLVIEIQHSSIDSREIKSREMFYGKMVWIFDATGAHAAGRLFIDRNTYHWEMPRLSIKNCQCPVFIEAEPGMLAYIKNITSKSYYKEDYHEHKTMAFVGECEVFTRDQFKGLCREIDERLNGKHINRVTGFKGQFDKTRQENPFEGPQLSLFN